MFQDPFEEADKAVLAEIAAQTKAKSEVRGPFGRGSMRHWRTDVALGLRVRAACAVHNAQEAAVAARKAEMARVEKLRKARSGERGEADRTSTCSHPSCIHSPRRV